jgi:tetratricopeptide (TPR) repeat protein
MNRTRLAVALLAALVAGVSLLFGGVFTDGEPESTVRVFSPPQTAIDGLADPNAALAELLAGFSTGDTAAFAAELESIVERTPSDSDALTLLGLTYQQRARETGDPSFYSLSDRALRQALELSPTQPLATTGLATLAVARHRFDDALVLARRAIGQNAEDASAYGALGDALLALGRHEEAFAAYDRMAVLSPSVASYSRVAHARQLLGRPADAVEALEAADELALTVPEHIAWMRVQLGTINFSRGRLDDAEAAFRAALAELPDYVHAEAGLAQVAAARGEYDAAVSALRRVVERLPASGYAILLADVLSAAGRTAEAEEAYELVDAIETLLDANGVRTELQTALFDLDHDRDLAGALERAQEAFEAAPGISAADTLAWALYKNGRCEEARTRSIDALSLGTRDGLMLFHRGMIEHCLGNQDDARAYLQHALELNPSFSFLHAPEARNLVEELEA